MLHQVFDLEILPLLPLNLRQLMKRIPSSLLAKVQEIRLREGKPLMCTWARGDCLLDSRGRMVGHREQAYLVTREDLQQSLQLMSNYSLYAFEEELRSGYLTVPGGHRVGLVGQAVLSRGKLKMQKYITGINIRFCREVMGAGERVLPAIISPTGEVLSTLIVSPPQCGKTTLVRDLARLLSNGVKSLNLPGQKVGLVDERSEIAGCFEGVPQNEVGIRTDVLDGCPKAEGMMLMIRSMSPRVLVTDEIGSLEDARAVEEAALAAVAVLATAHGSCREALLERPGLRKMFQHKIFKRLIFLSSSRGAGTVEKVWDEERSRGLTPG